jgi:hypothetical protein
MGYHIVEKMPQTFLPQVLCVVTFNGIASAILPVTAGETAICISGRHGERKLFKRIRLKGTIGHQSVKLIYVSGRKKETSRQSGSTPDEIHHFLEFTGTN